MAEHRTIPVVDRQLDVRSVQLIENPGVVNGHRHVQGATISEPNERRDIKPDARGFGDQPWVAGDAWQPAAKGDGGSHSSARSS